MAITYTWDCKTVDVYPEYQTNSDVIYKVHWRLNAVSDEQDSDGNNYKAFIYGTQGLSVDDIVSFIPFADLTTEIVTNWVINTMDEYKVNYLKEDLDTKIEEQINPISVTKKIIS